MRDDVRHGATGDGRHAAPLYGVPRPRVRRRPRLCRLPCPGGRHRRGGVGRLPAGVGHRRGRRPGAGARRDGRGRTPPARLADRGRRPRPAGVPRLRWPARPRSGRLPGLRPGARLPLRRDRDGPPGRTARQRTRDPGQRLGGAQAAGHLGERSARPATVAALAARRVPAHDAGGPADERAREEEPPGRRAQSLERAVEALAEGFSRTRRAAPAAASSPTSPDTPAATRLRSARGRPR